MFRLPLPHRDRGISAAPPVSIVPLVDADDGGGETPGLSRVSFPDRLSAVPHRTPDIDPYAADRERVVIARVDALADAGALDGYTFDVLDPILRAEQHQCEPSVRAHAVLQRQVQLSIIGAQREFLVQEQNELQAGLRHLAELRATYSAARAALGLPTVELASEPADLGLLHDLLTAQGVPPTNEETR